MIVSFIRRRLLLFVVFASMCDLYALSVVQDPNATWYPERVVLKVDCSASEKKTISYMVVDIDGEEIDVIGPYDRFIVIGGSARPLWPDTSYNVEIVAFDDQEKEIDRASVLATTGTWAGVYRWDNPSDEDNRGRCTSITVKAVLSDDLKQSGRFYELYDLQNDGNELRFFPIDGIRDYYSWHDYDEDSLLGLVYRKNAEKFNKTSFTPSRWIVSSIEISPVWYASKVKTYAIMFTVNTVTNYNFRINESSQSRELVFVLDGDGLCKMGMFFNPVPPPEGKAYYVLSEISN